MVVIDTTGDPDSTACIKVLKAWFLQEVGVKQQHLHSKDAAEHAHSSVQLCPVDGTAAMSCFFLHLKWKNAAVREESESKGNSPLACSKQH